MASYFLQTSKKRGTATLYVRINRPALGIKQWYVSTGISVDVETWNKAKGSTTALNRYYATDKGSKVYDMIQKVDAVINDAFVSGLVSSAADKPKLIQAISDVVNIEAIKTREEIAKREQREEERQREAEANRLCVVWNYYKYFVDAMQKGSLRTRKKHLYKENSVTIWKTFGKHLEDYLHYRGAENITFNEIGRAFADGFVTRLESKGLMGQTVNQQVSCFRRLCTAAAEDEKNASLISVKVWNERSVGESEKRAEIALSEEEINALYNMQLDGQRDQVRDIFILGFLTAQRLSDYGSLTKDNFKVTTNGLSVIVLTQKKTGSEVTVPILDERVMDICKKYDFRFPRPTRDVMNRQLKIILHELANSVPTLRNWERTVLTLKERSKEKWFLDMKKRVDAGEKLRGEDAKRYKRLADYAREHNSEGGLYRRDYSGAVIRQRWELVGSHTSRRSAVTSLYDSGLFDAKDIMSLTGHTTLTNYEKYIRRGAIEQAERIAEKVKKAKEIKMRKEA